MTSSQVPQSEQEGSPPRTRPQALTTRRLQLQKTGGAQPIGLWRRFIGEPRNAIFFAMAAALLIGGGRRLRRAILGRDARNLLLDPDVKPAQIVAVADFGRSALPDLFQLLESAKTQEQREAAGRALAILWGADDLIAEEEKAIVIRGHQVQWGARRRYPRGLKTEVPMTAEVVIPFLEGHSKGVRPDNLEWSFRLTGTRRAALEAFGPWLKETSQVAFKITPEDFETNGPHQLSLQARVRTVGLTSSWEANLPHSRFLFEFDPRLEVDSLLGTPDETRASRFMADLKLLRKDRGDDDRETAILLLGSRFALAHPPILRLPAPLPFDLSHRIELEFEGIERRLAAGRVVLRKSDPASGDSSKEADWPIGPVEGLEAEVIDRPGRRNVRAWLVPDAELGWTDPEIRSIRPETLVTSWLSVDVLRR